MNRTALHSLIAAAALALAACSQVTPPAQEPQDSQAETPTVVESSASEQVASQALTWRSMGLYNPPSSDPSAIKALGEFSSIALSSAGNPVIAYYDGSRNSHTDPRGPFGNGDLRLMICNTADCTGPNQTFVTVDRGDIYTNDVGRSVALALDSRGFAVMSYFDRDAGLKVARCRDATCTRRSIQVVQMMSRIGEYGNISMVLDRSDNPSISYAFKNSTYPTVRLVRCGNTDCNPNPSTLSTPGVTHTTVDYEGGLYTSLALDSRGSAVISYNDERNGDLRLALCINTNCTSKTLRTIDSTGDVGKFNALRLIPVRDAAGRLTQEIPFISYYDATNGDLKAVYCGDNSCSRNNFIQTLDSAGDVGRFTAQPRGNTKEFAISYYDATNGNLKYAVCDPGQLFARTPVMPCQLTAYNSVETADGAIRNDVGRNSSLVLDASGKAVISYYDATEKTLKWARQF